MNHIFANPLNIGRKPVETVSVPPERFGEHAVDLPLQSVENNTHAEQSIAPVQRYPQNVSVPVHGATATMMMSATSGLFHNAKFERCTFNFTIAGSNNQ